MYPVAPDNSDVVVAPGVAERNEVQQARGPGCAQASSMKTSTSLLDQWGYEIGSHQHVFKY